MRSLTAALIPSLFLALLAPAAARTDGVPTLNFEQSCREAQALGGDDRNLAYRGCMQDEKDAREQLAQKWSHFKPGDRRDCVAQGADPVPSYVEILTCLEMYDGASAFHRPSSDDSRARGGSAPAAASPSPLPGSAAPADAGAAKY
jgi:hypothetical protein